MKNINNLLRRASLTPLERVTALVHNDVHKQKTGKDILSKSELHTLTQGWAGQMAEVNEYNRYLEIVRLEGSMRMDARMFSYHSELSLVSNQRVLSYCLSDLKKTKEASGKEMMKGITQEEGIRYALEHTYLEYHDTLHVFTFNNLSKEIQSDLLLLDDSIAYSKQYLADEVLLYEMLKDGNLNQVAKDMLINLIFSRMYYDDLRKMRLGTERDGFLIGGFFAELPLLEVVHKVAHHAKIKCKDREEEDLLEDIETYAKEKNITMEDLAKEALNSWLDEGLFTREFVPIFTSDRFDTWNGNTEKSHKELFASWYEELERSKEYFASLFSSRKLKKQEVEMTILGRKRVIEMITGESLYACKENINIVEEYKKQLEMIVPFSNFSLFVEKYANPIKSYTTLCEFRKLAKKASDIFDAGFTEEYDKLIESYKDEVMLLNNEMRKLTDATTENLFAHTKGRFRYYIHIVDGRFGFDVEERSDAADIAQEYAEEFKKVMKE